MTRRHVRQVDGGGQIEVKQRPYATHTERQLVEVTAWESIEERSRLLFEVTDPARGRVEPAGAVLGTIPPAVRDALAALDYEVDDPQPTDGEP